MKFIDDVNVPSDEQYLDTVLCLQLDENEKKDFESKLIDKNTKIVNPTGNSSTSVMALIESDSVIDASKKREIFAKKIGDFITKNIGSLIDIERFGNLNKLLNVTAWCLRILRRLGACDGDLLTCEYITAEERNEALNAWIRANQDELKINPKYDDIRCSLNLTEDVNGILRAPGRLKRAPLPENRRSPIMLERTHWLAELILWDCHDRVWHNGPKETRTEFQSEYWVTQGYRFVNKILYRCVLCRFLNSRAYNYPKSPELPDLPFNDVNAFNVTGVDHFGPLYCRSSFRKSSPDKDDVYECHAALYTCASTRGIVLDLVPSTSSNDFF